MIRWSATVYYRTENGILDVIHELEEIADLHQRIENGPDWNTIQKIEIIRVGNPMPNLTVEEAMKL